MIRWILLPVAITLAAVAALWAMELEARAYGRGITQAFHWDTRG